MVDKFVWKSYVFLRNVVRSVVLSHPLLERSVTYPLLALENLLPVRWLAKHVAPNPIMCCGSTFYYRPEEDFSFILPILFHGSYEPETSKIFHSLISPGMTVVDLGAHIGYFTLLAAHAVKPNGRVYAFEPVPSTYELLVKNISINGCGNTVVAVPYAVSSKLGRVKIFLVKGSSVSAALYTHNQEGCCMEVRAITLDEFFKDEGWPQVDLIKMDIEGAEKVALEGMKRLNEKNPKLKLILEFNLHRLEQASVSPSELIQLLLDYGYCKFRVLRPDSGYLEISKALPLLVNLGRHLNLQLLVEKG